MLEDAVPPTADAFGFDLQALAEELDNSPFALDEIHIDDDMREAA